MWATVKKYLKIEWHNWDGAGMRFSFTCIKLLIIFPHCCWNFVVATWKQKFISVLCYLNNIILLPWCISINLVLITHHPVLYHAGKYSKLKALLLYEEMLCISPLTYLQGFHYNIRRWSICLLSRRLKNNCNLDKQVLPLLKFHKYSSSMLWINFKSFPKITCKTHRTYSIKNRPKACSTYPA